MVINITSIKHIVLTSHFAAVAVLLLQTKCAGRSM